MNILVVYYGMMYYLLNSGRKSPKFKTGINKKLEDWKHDRNKTRK